MDAKLIEKLNELNILLGQCSQRYHAVFDINVRTIFEKAVIETSEDTSSGYRPGGIVEIEKPVFVVRYSLWQEEMSESIHPLPFTLRNQFIADISNVDFHIHAVAKLIMEKSPSVEEWDAAEKKYVENWHSEVESEEGDDTSF